MVYTKKVSPSLPDRSFRLKFVRLDGGSDSELAIGHINGGAAVMESCRDVILRVARIFRLEE